jgi:hypothetical protein
MWMLRFNDKLITILSKQDLYKNFLDGSFPCLRSIDDLAMIIAYPTKNVEGAYTGEITMVNSMNVGTDFATRSSALKGIISAAIHTNMESLPPMIYDVGIARATHGKENIDNVLRKIEFFIQNPESSTPEAVDTILLDDPNEEGYIVLSEMHYLQNGRKYMLPRFCLHYKNGNFGVSECIFEHGEDRLIEQKEDAKVELSERERTYIMTRFLANGQTKMGLERPNISGAVDVQAYWKFDEKDEEPEVTVRQ